MKKLWIALCMAVVLITATSVAQADYKTIDVYDTSFDDWEIADILVSDAQGDVDPAYIDWYDVFAANDETNLYLSYTTDDDITLDWHYEVFFDTVAGSGYGWMGAEYMLEGTTLFEWNGSSWDEGVAVQSYVSGTQAEFEISRALLGSPTSFDAKLFAPDDGQDWAIADTYSMAEAPSPPVPEPSSLLLLGSGIFGLLTFAKRKKD